MNELDNLVPIEKNSRRGSRQAFDLYHDAEDNHFTVSDTVYANLDMNNNGFTAHIGNDAIYLSVQPNEESVSYKGREGFDKGKAFTSSVTSEAMKKLGLTGSLTLNEVGERDGKTFYKVERATSKDEITEEVAEPVAETETANEELA